MTARADTFPTDIFPEPLLFKAGPFNRGVRWFWLTDTFPVVTSAGRYDIEKGFLTDGLSVPRFAWPAIGPTSQGFEAGVFHDWAYSKASAGIFPGDRKLADDVFLELMWHLHLSWYERHTIHLAVRAGGWRSYRQR